MIFFPHFLELHKRCGFSKDRNHFDHSDQRLCGPIDMQGTESIVLYIGRFVFGTKFLIDVEFTKTSSRGPRREGLSLVVNNYHGIMLLVGQLSWEEGFIHNQNFHFSCHSLSIGIE